MARRVALAGHTFLPSRKEGRKGPGRKWTEERRGGEGIRSSWITHIQIMVMTDRFPPSFLWSIRRGGPFDQLPTCNDRHIILIRSATGKARIRLCETDLGYEGPLSEGRRGEISQGSERSVPIFS